MTAEPAPAAAPAESAAPATVEPAAPAPAPEKAPSAQKYVPDFGSPEANARFTEVYAGMRQNERRARALADQNEMLMTKLAEIGGKVEQIEGAGRENVIAELKARLAAATERADGPAVTELTDRLVEARVAAARPKAPVSPPPEAPTEGGLSAGDMQVLQSWVQQTDPNGMLYRPWAQEGHVRHKAVASIVASVLDDPNYDGQSMQVKLVEADRRIMAALAPRAAQTAKPAAAAVLPGSTTKAPKDTAGTLTAEQKVWAERMFLGVKTLSGKVLATTPAEAHERYLKQMKVLT